MQGYSCNVMQNVRNSSEMQLCRSVNGFDFLCLGFELLKILMAD